MRRITLFTALSTIMALVIFVVPFRGEAQGEKTSPVNLEMRDDIRVLRDEIGDLKKEVRALRRLIESRLPGRPSPPPRPVTGATGIEGDPTMGKRSAPLVLVEFSDYQCPYCGRFSRSSFPQIKEEYVDKGKVRYVFKDFPLAFHKDAQKAAEAAHCAGEEGKYWEMHDLLFENQGSLGMDDLHRYARDVGLKTKAFTKCLKENRYAQGIKADIEAGKASGINGTPSFILGRMNSDGKVEGSVISGAQPYGVFKSAIEGMLNKQ